MTQPRGRVLSVERPFAGLRPFGEEDAAFFFGREDHVYALYRLFDFSRFIAIVGSSGSGKSSLVRAGLLPLLAQAVDNWRSVSMRPGDRPLAGLCDALTRLAQAIAPADDQTPPEIFRQRIDFHIGRSGEGIVRALDETPGLGQDPVLLVVDQFEEIFRYAAPQSATLSDRAALAAQSEESAAFVRRLLEASRFPGRRCHIVITLRSDFIGDCARYFELPEAVSGSQYLCPALTRDQREDAIRLPLKASGSTIDGALVERLLRDTGRDLDQLPVMQHCLARLWLSAEPDDSGARHIGEDNYGRVGGIERALSQHADEVMASLENDVAVERLFRALSERDRDGRATRRPRPFAGLVDETGVPPDELRRVIDAFRADECSFVVPETASVPTIADNTYIDVVHEALLRKWEKLSADGGWLDIEEQDARTYRALLAILGV